MPPRQVNKEEEDAPCAAREARGAWPDALSGTAAHSASCCRCTKRPGSTSRPSLLSATSSKSRATSSGPSYTLLPTLTSRCALLDVPCSCAGTLIRGNPTLPLDWLRAANKKRDQPDCLALDRGPAVFRVRHRHTVACARARAESCWCIAEACRGRAQTASLSTSWCTRLFCRCARRACADVRRMYAHGLRGARALVGCAATRQAGAAAAEGTPASPPASSPAEPQAGTCQQYVCAGACLRHSDARADAASFSPEAPPAVALKAAPAPQKQQPQPQKRAPQPRPPPAPAATPRRFFPNFKLDVDAVMRAYDSAPEA
jgi:hypothetical protein